VLRGGNLFFFSSTWSMRVEMRRLVGVGIGEKRCIPILAHGAEQQLGQSEDAMPRATLASDWGEQFGCGGGARPHGRRDHLLGGDHSSAGMSHFGLELTKAGLQSNNQKQKSCNSDG
jgi:hypothetical protein